MVLTSFGDRYVLVIGERCTLTLSCYIFDKAYVLIVYVTKQFLMARRKKSKFKLCRVDTYAVKYSRQAQVVVTIKVKACKKNEDKLPFRNHAIYRDINTENRIDHIQPSEFLLVSCSFHNCIQHTHTELFVAYSMLQNSSY